MQVGSFSILGRWGENHLQRGFTYIWSLFAVALMSAGLALVGPMWAEVAKRDREQDLLRIGQIYAQAIASYYHASPGADRRYPPSLEALLQDTRLIGTQRHLRRLYADPLAPSQGWGLLRAADGGVRGVYSQSEDQPLRREPIEVGLMTLPAANHYSQWQFVARIE